MKNLRSAPVGAAVCLAVLGSAWCGVARAEGGAAPSPEHQVSLTISPVHLLLPVAEVSGEYRVQDKVGVAGIVGFGTTTVKVLDEESTFSVVEVGASARYYVLGTFDHGMQLGLEALYVYVSGDVESEGVTATGVGSGLSVGPFVGYKVIADVGFTFDAQLGYGATVLGATAEATDGTESSSASESDVQYGPLLNLNVGWSF